jgi:hypothetical protein
MSPVFKPEATSTGFVAQAAPSLQGALKELKVPEKFVWSQAAEVASGNTTSAANMASFRVFFMVF